MSAGVEGSKDLLFTLKFHESRESVTDPGEHLV